MLAVIGGAIKSSSIISSVSSSPVNDDEDFVGDYKIKIINKIFESQRVFVRIRCIGFVRETNTILQLKT